jgi:type II restriction/modification system DNA methylase subunit YeeA
LHARRLVAQCCLYGVDKNPLATDLAKLSLWLATLARDHEFTFLDHAFKSGDSLVGAYQGTDCGSALGRPSRGYRCSAS